MNPVRPPRPAQWLLGAVTPRHRWEDVLGDLEERFQRRRATTGRAAASWWYWRQTLLFALRIPVERLVARRRRARERAHTLASHNTLASSWDTMHSFWKDIQYAFRALGRAPGFAAVAILTIGLGIGANTAIFSVVRAVLLRPLPYAEPDQLVMVWGRLTARNVENFPTAFPTLRDFRTQTTEFDDLAGVFTFAQALTGDDGEPEQISVGGATYNLMSLLGVTPLLGRAFLEDDAVPGGAPLPAGAGGAGNNAPTAAMLSHGFWQRRFGGDPAVVGRSIVLDGNSVEVVGVLPPDFTLLMPPVAGVEATPDAWVALRIDYDQASPLNVALSVVGRMKPGVTIAQAQADIDRVAEDIRSRIQVYNTAGFDVRIVPMQRDLTADVRPVLFALLGAVGFVLLIACANVSNLLLVRATGRQREIAVRSALGGSRGRIVRQMLTESAVLALLGGAVGFALAAVGIEGLVALRPDNLPRIDTIGLDATVLVFTAAASLAAAVIFGLVPAWHTSNPNLNEFLKSRGVSTGRQRLLRNGVVVVEMALTMVLLIGAGLMVRSFVALQRVDPGFNPSGVVAFTLNIPPTRYPDPQERMVLAGRIQERLESVAGVQAASAVFPLPLKDVIVWGRYGTADALADETRFRQANYRFVLPRYLDVMETTLLEGRRLTAADVADSSAVVLVDEVLAAATWPDESAVGKRLLIRLGSPEPQWVDVVGVVRNQRQISLAEEGRETIYFTVGYGGLVGPMNWVVRSTIDPSRVVGEMRRELAIIDPLMPMADVKLMNEYVVEAMAPTRFSLVLIGVFGALALILASVGLYGVLSYLVRQRTAEIGIRVAFGARPGTILRLVVGQGMALAAIGVGTGLLAAVGLTRLMTGLLVGVTPTDPVTYAVISVVFGAVSLGACYIPAWQATRVDPLTALQRE